MRPADAYTELVAGNVEYVKVGELNGRIPAVMLVPYPPGIPVIMPGERFTDETKKIIDYLAVLEDFDNTYPGFENEIHGVMVRQEKNKKVYNIYCIVN